jgi:hypothetical protein
MKNSSYLSFKLLLALLFFVVATVKSKVDNPV